MREISLKIQYSALVLKKDDWRGIGVQVGEIKLVLCTVEPPHNKNF